MIPTLSSPVFDTLANTVVLLPWGPGHPDDEDDENDQDDVRCTIERLQGQVAYAVQPQRPHRAYGKNPKDATHEYVPTGAQPTTSLPALHETALYDVRQAAEQSVLIWLAQHRRAAYVPVVTPIAEQGVESRYFGAPWLPDGMAWPTLHGDRMRFVMQINIATVPQTLAALGGHQGLLLVFHSEHYEDGPAMSHVVLVDPQQPGRVHHVSGLTDTNPALAITAWHEVIDMPHMDTLEGMDGYSEEVGDVLMEIGSDTWLKVKTLDGTDVPEREAIECRIVGPYHTYSCDKLGGWPDWEQGDETPEDRDGAPMDYVLQIGHEGLLFVDPSVDLEAIDWPTWGRGQVFWSARTGEGAYVWACD